MEKNCNMKAKLLITFLTVATILTSCGGQRQANEETIETDTRTQTYIYKDSCKLLALSLSIELPLGKDSASVQIRDSLIAEFVSCASNPGYSDGDTPVIKPYRGDGKDAQALVDYYGRTAYERLLKMVSSEYEERMQYLDEDTTMTEEDKAQIRSDFPQWAFDLKIAKSIDTESYVVYSSQTYCYYGGAHGGIIGDDLTFEHSTGKKIEHFIKADATASIQPLIRKGLMHYYSEAGDPVTDKQLSERLQIEGNRIPLPQRATYPNVSGDSLVFTYAQYEIACYADGMPSFSLSVNDLLPYLTPEGKALLTQHTESVTKP